MAKRDYFQNLRRDLESHTEVRRFGSGWLSGFFGLLFAIAGFFMVVALRFPDWFATPELAIIKHWGGFRGLVHAVLLVSYGLSLPVSRIWQWWVRRSRFRLWSVGW